MMMRIFYGVLLSMAMAQTDEVKPQKPLLSVFYEAKCKPCWFFMVKQLLPTIQEFQNSVELKFVPYGNAETLEDGSFECENGPSECYSNLVQDCTLHYMTDASNVAKTEYVVCEMQTLAATRRDFECVERARVPVGKVRKCVTGDQGTLLQVQSRILTRTVKTNFVPTITINNVYKKAFQELAMTQLHAALSTLIQDNISFEFE